MILMTIDDERDDEKRQEGSRKPDHTAAVVTGSFLFLFPGKGVPERDAT